MNIYFKMCDGYIFNVFFKEIVGKKETTGLRLKGRGLRLTGYHSTSKLEKTEKKKKKKRNSYCLWVHTHPTSLIIPRPHPLPISSTSSTSDMPGGKAKRFILWQEPKTKNLKLLQSSDL